jgi:hypothetical protein
LTDGGGWWVRDWQIFIFLTISKFGALTSSIMGLVRKVVTLLLSIYVYGHSLSGIQALGLVVAFAAMVTEFVDKKVRKPPGEGAIAGDKGGAASTPTPGKGERELQQELRAQTRPLLSPDEDDAEEDWEGGSPRAVNGGGLLKKEESFRVDV